MSVNVINSVSDYIGRSTKLTNTLH